MTDRVESFRRGERTDDVALYLADSIVDDLGTLEEHGVGTDDGVLLVVDGERGRSAFEAMTGTRAMTFASEAMAFEGIVDESLTDGTCPDAVDTAVAGADGEDDDEHHVRFLLAFAEEQNEDVGGLYAEGNVLHAYVQCGCGTAYSDRWVASVDRAPE